VQRAFACERFGDPAAADRLLARAAQVAGSAGLRCLISYRAIAALAHLTFEWRSYGKSLADMTCAEVSAILDRLEVAAADDAEGGDRVEVAKLLGGEAVAGAIPAGDVEAEREYGDGGGAGV
jgi:hypothetical protein